MCFFGGWAGLGRTLLVGPLAYVALVFMLRASGKRTLSKMNAFDLIVTVALGSTLATVLLNRSVPLAEGVMALGLLISLQFVITWLSVRSERFQGLVKAEPTLIMREGAFLDGAMRRQRITREEIEAAMRESGLGDVDDVACAVLETDGSVSIIGKSSDGS
ncbi:DUF421 domain-containing protein [Roseibium salinum]|nr:DUF421 domain-containing protein [Roseibium salinum]